MKVHKGLWQDTIADSVSLGLVALWGSRVEGGSCNGS